MHRGTPGPGPSSPAEGTLLPRPRILRLNGYVAFDRAAVDVDSSCASVAALVRASSLAGPSHPDGQGTAATGTTLRVQVGCDPGSSAWQQVMSHAPRDFETLPGEGYVLIVSGEAEQPWAVVAGADPAGAYYGVQSLLALTETRADGFRLPAMTVTDWPELGWRGTIEGFYGPPWSHTDRLAHLEFAGQHKLNTYVYAPKDDPFHRARWREPYPPAELAQLAELVDVAHAHHVRFVFTISPGLSMVYSDPAELALLDAKLEQVWQIGVRDIGLLFDDIEPELSHEPDITRFGAEAGSSALAHAAVCRHVTENFLGPRGADRPLLMVPTDYAGTKPSPYRERLAGALADDVLVWWTGYDVVVGDVTREHIDEAAKSYRHRLLLWDNFPVNDFDFSRVFLGPLLGRTTDLAGAPLAGVTANPMPHAAASQIALATVADWAWNPVGYDPATAHRRVVSALRGGTALESLIEACSSWPPSAPQHPELSALLAAVLAEEGGASDTAEAVARAHAVFTAMIQPAEPATAEGVRLAAELRPWLETQAAMGQAGLAALAWLASPSTENQAAMEAALTDAHECKQNVLQSVVPPFVEGFLRRH